MATVADSPPAGPRGHWLTGNLPEFRRDRLGLLARCTREHGDVVMVRIGPRRILLVSDPRLIEEVLVSKSGQFIKHAFLRFGTLILGQGLLTSEGDLWRRQRRLIQPAFQRDRVAAAGSAISECAERLLDSWQPGQTRDIMADMAALTLRIASRTLFGAEADGDAGTVSSALRALQASFISRLHGLVPVPKWIPIPRHVRMWRAVRQLDEIVYGMIRQRRQQPGPRRDDLLSRLLEARDAQDGRGMSYQQLRDEVMTLFLAGHETTALGLSWAWYLLARHPQAERRLAAEVDQALGGRPPAVRDVPRLRYTTHVITEALRLYPPAYAIGREPLRDCVLGGYSVRRGTTLVLSPWVVQRDPRHFEDPEAFCPERWEGDLARKVPHFAYFPFGGGPRRCVGEAFAMQEMVMVLAAIARRYRFTLAPGPEIVPRPLFTLRPDPGVFAVLAAREGPVGGPTPPRDVR
jgi:cytochrome P450